MNRALTPNLETPTQIVLETPADLLNYPWPQTKSPAFSGAANRWQAYLNQVCWQAFLPWLCQEQGWSARVWPAAALPSVWEFVNGVAIEVLGAAPRERPTGGTHSEIAPCRLVLVPSAALDHEELRVPQEWVDCPDWLADYYLAVQIDPEEGLLRVWGYTTHQRLKTQGVYDPHDRTYSLATETLIQDLQVLWVSHQLQLDSQLRSAVAPLPELTLVQAQNLLDRLGRADLIWPRLAVPFAQWAALLSHGGWRQKLYERRQGLAESRSLRQWFREGVSELAQEIGWILQSPTPLHRGEAMALFPTASRPVTIAGQSYELKVICYNLQPETETGSQELQWRFDLSHQSAPIPEGLKLRLLTASLESLVESAAIATHPSQRLSVDVTLMPGSTVVWEIEPTPDDYEREILCL